MPGANVGQLQPVALIADEATPVRKEGDRRLPGELGHGERQGRRLHRRGNPDQRLLGRKVHDSAVGQVAHRFTAERGGFKRDLDRVADRLGKLAAASRHWAWLLLVPIDDRS